MNTYSYALIIDKGSQNSLFNKCCWENWICACRKLKLDPCLSPYTIINSKWIKDLNLKPETLKLVQERVGNTLEFIAVVQNKTQMTQQLRERIDKWDCMKLKRTTKEMIARLKRQTTEWEKSFSCCVSDKGLIIRIYREH
jgi:hypothetical protein